MNSMATALDATHAANFDPNNNRMFFMQNGVLNVNGTSLSETIKIEEIGASLVRASVMSKSGTKRFNVQKSRVTSIDVFGGAGNDQISNLTSFRSTIRGGSGKDRLIGGRNNDSLFGNGGNDVLSGKGGNDLIKGGLGDDRIIGGSGRDQLLGEAGNDIVWGGLGRDVIKGGDGNDQLIGDSGNDTIYGGNHNDKIWGGSGDDRIVGGAGNDVLQGGDGADGILGGQGTDWIWGQAGGDRILVTVDDRVQDLSYADAKINFVDGPKQSVKLGNSTLSYAAGKFSVKEILQIDQSFQLMQRVTGSTRMLKQYNGNPVTFYRHGTELGKKTNTLAWNSGGKEIHLPNPAFQSKSWLQQNVIHELGHNWDDPVENRSVHQFRAISGWRVVGQRWVFNPSAKFVRSYGSSGPGEDFSTSMAAYFMQFSNLKYNGTPGAKATPVKMQYMHWLTRNIR